MTPAPAHVRVPLADGRRLYCRDHGGPGPALLALHGHFAAGQARAMAGRRPGTRLVELDTGHTVHETDPEGFAAAVLAFLARR
ncbi:hypothetical protein GCM10018785_23700 [Streptomyces longispororuber]|uniref:Alpha/beta hydrolase n=1 Tax=Streptomyces longispororuber TaxID=68230 RepID=A0A919DJB2_9ACTN|nr:hypothetical protein [Streptomyces longispororuber]GHE53409.1 hypothetical protein GCM10018785_23700 [Streptomyces longispororuber]